MHIHMDDLLTTDEAAAYLRISERKLYDLVSTGAVPCTKVTGRWLFPKPLVVHQAMGSRLYPFRTTSGREQRAPS